MTTLLIGINSKYIHPSMGIFQVVANSNSPITYKEFTIKDNTKVIVNFIENSDFNILGFSVYIWNIQKVKEIINLLNENIVIVLGGSEVSYRPNDFLKYKNVQYIIKNEGEKAFNELIEYLNHQREVTKVSNLFYRESDNFVYTYDDCPNIKKIKHNYSLIEDFKNRIVYLESSRGCGFKCSYCLASLDKKIRQLEINKVKQDVLFALEKKAKTIKFLDRSFNIDKEYMRNIFNFIKEHDNHYTTFQFEIVADLLDSETNNLIKTIRKGLIRFEIGIQSTNAVVTKAVRRVQDFDILKKNIFEIKDNITIHLDLIAGLPYEDLNSFINTFNQTFMLFCEELQLGFLKELKGTHISETKDLHDYRFDNNPPYEIIDNKYISSEDLDDIRLVEKALNRYYNSNNYPKTMDYLFINKKMNPFHTFLKIGKALSTISKIQLDTLCELLYQTFQDEELLFYLKQDYLMKDKIKPKIWWETNIDKLLRKEIFTKFIIKYPFLNIENLYRYSRLEQYQDNFFLVTYKPLNIYFLY